MLHRSAFLFALFVIMTGCSRQNMFRQNYHSANNLLHDAGEHQVNPYLKAHMKNGDVCILSNTWKIDTALGVITGNVTRYNFNRYVITNGPNSIPIDSILIFETNTSIKDPSGGSLSMLGIVTAGNLIVTTICLTNPKACFGSCPTFYLDSTSDVRYSDAEGFSNAIAPSLEYSDIDALGLVHNGESPFRLTMKNEALETHCVNSILLYDFKAIPGTRVYHTVNDRFYRCSGMATPAIAKGPEGDVLPLLRRQDKKERFSLSDPTNLDTKEEIELRFNPVESSSDSLGFVLDFRQTMLTTYLIYNAIAYMGDEVSDVFARIEKSPSIRNSLKKGIKSKLGGIEVAVWNEQQRRWITQGEFYETGPIAVNSQLLKVATYDSHESIRVKLKLNKGLWRIDRAGLTELVVEEKPTVLNPTRIIKNGVEYEEGLTRLKDPDGYLVSLPGDRFSLEFAGVTPSADHDLFLDSRGYYLEWMRDYWMQQKDLHALRLLQLRPSAYLKRFAAPYKKYEQYIEEEFWNSKIRNNIFSEHGN